MKDITSYVKESQEVEEGILDPIKISLDITKIQGELWDIASELIDDDKYNSGKAIMRDLEAEARNIFNKYMKKWGSKALMFSEWWSEYSEANARALDRFLASRGIAENLNISSEEINEGKVTSFLVIKLLRLIVLISNDFLDELSNDNIKNVDQVFNVIKNSAKQLFNEEIAKLGIQIDFDTFWKEFKRIYGDTVVKFINKRKNKKEIKELSDK